MHSAEKIVRVDTIALHGSAAVVFSHMIEGPLLLAFLLILFLVKGWGNLTLLVVLLLLDLFCLPGLWVIARRDPPFVPTMGKSREAMLEFAHVQPGDTVYDLGCGDGRFVLASAALGARAIGYELSLPAYLIAKIRTFGVRGSSILFRNFWKQRYEDADVIFCYLMRESMQPFLEKIWSQLKPGCRVVSHVNALPGITPVQHRDDVYLFVKGA